MIPASESLKQVVERTRPFWDEVIVPRLRMNKKVLIVGHENNLRSILKVLDKIPDSDIINVDIPRSIPLVYTLDPVTLAPMGNRYEIHLYSHDYCCTFIEQLSGYYFFSYSVISLFKIIFRDPETLLTGKYLGAKDVIKGLQERDRVQVYDLNVQHNLETVC